MSDTAPILDGIAATLNAMGLTVDDLAAHVDSASDTPAGGRRYPLLAEHLAQVRSVLGDSGSLRAWNAHFKRLEAGTPQFCSCQCDARASTSSPASSATAPAAATSSRSRRAETVSSGPGRS